MDDWIMNLHLATLSCWCAALLYLPVAVMTAERRAGEPGGRWRKAYAKQIFTLVATPAAMLAIASGLVLFMGRFPLGLSQVVKLGTVIAMVLCHALCGCLIVRGELQPYTGLPVERQALVVAGGASFLVAVWLGAVRPW